MTLTTEDVAALVARLRDGLTDPENCSLVQPAEARALLDHIAAQDAALSTLAGERDGAERALLTVQNAAKTIAAAHGTELEHLRQNASFDHSLRAEVESLRQHNSEMTDALLAAEARATTAEAQVVAMREALEPFASVDFFVAEDPDERVVSIGRWEMTMALPRFYADVQVSVFDVRRARTALLAGTPPSGAETQEKVDG